MARTPEEEVYITQKTAQLRAASDGLAGAVITLRQWAADARGTTVTAGNAVATLQVVVNRLGVFFDRFADLLVTQGHDAPAAGPTQQKAPG